MFPLSGSCVLRLGGEACKLVLCKYWWSVLFPPSCCLSLSVYFCFYLQRRPYSFLDGRVGEFPSFLFFVSIAWLKIYILFCVGFKSCSSFLLYLRGFFFRSLPLFYSVILFVFSYLTLYSLYLKSLFASVEAMLYLWIEMKKETPP